MKRLAACGSRLARSLTVAERSKDSRSLTVAALCLFLAGSLGAQTVVIGPASTAADLTVHDPIEATQLIVKQGPSQGSLNVFESQTSAGTMKWRIDETAAVLEGCNACQLNSSGVLEIQRTHNQTKFGGSSSACVGCYTKLVTFESDMAPTSGGPYDGVALMQNFKPGSGSADFSSLHVEPTINQTGGANGITRGFYLEPTITAAVDFRGIEVADLGTSRYAFLTGTGLWKIGDSVEPTCDATARGVIALVQGGASVADTYRICMKDAADAYGWKAMATP